MSEYSETQKILKKMEFLSKNLSRRIIHSLLEEKNDMRSLSKKLGKGRTSVFKTLKKLEKMDIVGYEKEQRETVGRKKKIYFVKDIEIPRITRALMKELLDGKDIRGKYIETGELERVINELSRIKIRTDDGFVPLRPLAVLNYLTKCGVNITESLRVLIGIHGLYKGEKIDQFTEDISKYILDNDILNKEESKKFENFFSRKIPIIIKKKHNTETNEIGMKMLQEIVKSELELKDYEALLLSSSLASFFGEWGYEAPYEFFIICAYYLALQHQFDCNKPAFYDNYTIINQSPEKEIIQVTIGEDTSLWNFEKLSGWIAKTFSTDLEIAKYVAFIVLEKMRFIDFTIYSSDFIKVLCNEIIREHNLK